MKKTGWKKPRQRRVLQNQLSWMDQSQGDKKQGERERHTQEEKPEKPQLLSHCQETTTIFGISWLENTSKEQKTFKLQSFTLQAARKVTEGEGNVPLHGRGKQENKSHWL